MDADTVKSMAFELGADLCGIAPENRFRNAPPGFRPADLDETCRSVIVLAKRLPPALLEIDDSVKFSEVNSRISETLDQLVVKFASRLNNLAIKAYPLLSDGSSDCSGADSPANRPTLSLTQSAFLAGLGVFGKNGLLMNQTYGSMIRIGVVLVDLVLTGDPAAEYGGCPPECRLCIDACPAKALDGLTVNYARCAPTTNGVDAAGRFLKKCSRCRLVCPNAFGVKA